jgi:hypothetical protein
MKNKYKIALFIITLFTSSQAMSQCACCAGASMASSIIENNSGLLTLNKHQFISEFNTDYRTINNAGAPEEEEKLLTNIIINSLGIRYGLQKNLTISAVIPYVILNTNNGKDKGFGDLNLIGTYNIISKNKFNFGLIAGAELPTGIKKASAFDNTTVVVGSGSLDPIAGLLFSHSEKKLNLQVSTLFKKTTKGFNDNSYGSLSQQSISASYRLKGQNTFCSTDSSARNDKSINWSVFVGYYGEWLGKIIEDGEKDDNSGYYAGFMNAGTTINYKKFAFPVSVSFPIITYMNGQQNPPGYRVKFGIMKSF